MVHNAAGGPTSSNYLCALPSQSAVMLNKEKGWIGNVSGGTWNGYIGCAGQVECSANLGTGRGLADSGIKVDCG
jgi:hypothetical protein